MRAAVVRTLAFSLVALAARDARAQVVRGDVADGATQAPLFGTLVVVVDTNGARVGGAITNDSGRFAIRLPHAGHFKLRAERIGYISGAYVPIDVGEGETVVQHLSAATAVAVLPTDTIVAGNRCVVRPTEGVKTAALWEEARKVLYASEITGQEQMVWSIRKRWFRSLDGASLAVRKDSTVVDSTIFDRPFRTEVTPDDLAKYGYGIKNDRGDSALTGPDADVLLSDAFARTHCFNVRLDGDKHAGLVGLAFEPARKVHFPEVTGVLWLDSVTAQLRFVEFRHTNLYPQVSPLKYGGRMDFAELPGGLWIIKRWYIRLPVIANGPVGAGGAEFQFMAGPHVARFHEEGGEVLQARVQTKPPPPTR